MTLPQLDADLFLTDGGLETTLVFHHRLDLPDFAAFPLLETDEGRDVLAAYYRPYLDLAERLGRGIVLDTPTWRANPDWGARLGYDQPALADLNRDSVDFVRSIAGHRPGLTAVLDGVVGPRGDGYVVGETMTEEEAERYHSLQIQAFAEAGADLVTAVTMTYAAEAIGIVRAAQAAGLPAVVSFTTETDGRLPSQSTLAEAVSEVDDATGAAAAYFMVNCAHPTHFADALDPDAPWTSPDQGDPGERLDAEPRGARRSATARPRRRGRPRRALPGAARAAARPARGRRLLRDRPRAHHRDRRAAGSSEVTARSPDPRRSSSRPPLAEQRAASDQSRPPEPRDRCGTPQHASPCAGRQHTIGCTDPLSATFLSKACGVRHRIDPRAVRLRHPCGPQLGLPATRTRRSRMSPDTGSEHARIWP